MPRNRTVIEIGFYGGLLAVLVGILFEIFPMFLPAAVADRIGNNSEGVLLALLLALWIQFARTDLSGSPREWPVAAAAAFACLAIAVFLLLTDFPTRFRTLNEAFLAASVLIPYVQVRRPLPPNLATWLSVAVLAVIVFGQRTQVVTDLAETLGVLVLAPIGFDIVDRGILDPRAVTSTRLRYAWYAILVITPIAFSVLEYGVGLSGVAGEVTRYAVRIAEAFLFMLLVEMYFAMGLGRTGQRSGVVSPEAPVQTLL
ncbi:MAG: hypothetical protein WD965_02925 [Actinomycetota bacterium]